MIHMLQQIAVGFSVVFLIAILFHELGEPNKKKDSKSTGGGPNFAHLFMFLMMPVFAIGGVFLLLGKALYRMLPLLLPLFDGVWAVLKKLIGFLGRAVKVLVRSLMKTLHALATIARELLASAWKLLKAAGRFILKTVHALFTVLRHLPSFFEKAFKALLRLMNDGRLIVGKMLAAVRAVGRFISTTAAALFTLLRASVRGLLRAFPLLGRIVRFVGKIFPLLFWFTREIKKDDADDQDRRIEELEQSVADLRTSHTTLVHAKRPALVAVRRRRKDGMREEKDDSGGAQTGRSRSLLHRMISRRGTENVDRSAKDSRTHVVASPSNRMKSETQSEQVIDVIPTLQRIGLHTRKRLDRHSQALA